MHPLGTYCLLLILWIWKVRLSAENVIKTGYDLLSLGWTRVNGRIYMYNCKLITKIVSFVNLCTVCSRMSLTNKIKPLSHYIILILLGKYSYNVYNMWYVLNTRYIVCSMACELFYCYSLSIVQTFLKFLAWSEPLDSRL